jgi:CIC family chloride channel protein
MRWNKLITKFYRWRLQKINENTFILILAVVIGVLSGFVALGLKLAVFYLRKLSMDRIIGDDKFRLILLLIFPTIGIGLTLFFKYFVIKDTIKHNISSILSAISKKNSIMRRHKVFSSMLGGTLTAGFGGSVGLESPIISSGAAIGSNLGRIFHFNYKTITLLLACGSSGAIAAIFNTPIAGVVFALEVLLLDLSRFSLIPLLIASVSGTIVTTIFYPESILFDFQIKESFHVYLLPFYLIFALICGFVANYFSNTYLTIEKRIEKIVNPYRRFLIGSLGFGILLLIFPPLWGEGFSTIKALMSENHHAVLDMTLYSQYSDNLVVIFLVFIFLILLKVVATALSVGAGGIGGIFAPSLYTGAITGYLFAFFVNSLDIGVHLPLVNFTMIGMAGLLSGVLHAPLTGLFLIAEITFGYELIVPLMIVTTISFLTSKYYNKNSIITAQLAAEGQLITHNKDQAVLTMMKLKSVIETDFLTISIDANLGDLVKIVSKAKRNIFPVIDHEGFLAGVILLDDIREIMFNQDLYKKHLVRNLMTSPPAFIKMDDKMDAVMHKFNQSKAWNLPVIEKGRYVGFVSKSKLFNVYRQQLVEITAE